MDARRGLRWLRRLSGRWRPGQVRAGAGRVRGRASGLRLRSRRGGAAGSGRHGSRRPALVSPAERRTAAVRGVPGLQAGPRPQRLSVTGALAEAGAASCAPGAEPPAPRPPLLLATFPSAPDAEGTGGRHKVAGAR